MSENQEYSKSGSPIIRYKKTEKEAVFVPPSGGSTGEIEAHLKKHVGNAKPIWQELVSPIIHIDVYLVEPTAEHDFYTLVTSGMSDKAMTAPYRAGQYAELMICLPSDWKIDTDEFKNDRTFWPLSWLKRLARLPHQYKTWFWESHTIPNGDPPQPYADDTELCCALLSAPVLFGSEFRTLEIRKDKVINFLSFIPIYREEMQYKLDHGIDGLYSRFDKFGVTELLDINRPNTCRGSGTEPQKSI
jgi:hypothetical protein